MRRSAASLKRPKDNASFQAFLTYYTQRKGLSQSKLAVCSRINQSRMNKIFTGMISDLRVETLVAICLALGLNITESKDLLARAERAFSPALSKHAVYLELIEIYASKTIDYKVDRITLSTVLDEADEILLENGFPDLPNANL